MIRRPPGSTRTDTLFPYTTLFRSRITHFGVGKRWPQPGAESVRFDLAQCHRHRSNVVEPSVIAIRIAERVIDVGGGIERSIPSEEGSATHLAWDAATALMIVENTISAATPRLSRKRF